MVLDKNSQQPLYVQLMQELKELIYNGKYKAGDQIPIESELSDIYGVSRITVRRTIEELCSQGVLIKRQGKGTFVETPKIYRKVEQEGNLSFTETCRVNGRKPSSAVLSCHIEAPEYWQREFLALAENEMIYHIQRVLAADEMPVMFEHIYLPVKRFPEFQMQMLEDSSLFKVIKETYQIQQSDKSRSTIEVGTVMQEVSEHLRMSAGEPVMLMKNYMRDREEKPLYISYDIIVGSRYRISV